jgi:hypothetical protein
LAVEVVSSIGDEEEQEETRKFFPSFVVAQELKDIFPLFRLMHGLRVGRF